MNKEWIAARRKEIEAQRDAASAQVNACMGALQMLDLIDAEIQKPQHDTKVSAKK